MSAEATAAMVSAPEAEMIEVEVANAPAANRNDNDAFKPQQHSKPIGLHSPPDSNSAMKLDGSDDSELSDLDDPSLVDINVNLSPPPPSPLADQDHDHAQDNTQEDEEEDIGEVVPAEWSGTVPVFRPDMHQFKDFKKFVRPSSLRTYLPEFNTR